MGLLDKIKDLSRSGQITWRDRIKIGVVLVSPSGVEYIAKYIDDEQSKDKNLHIVKYPNIPKNYVRDLDINSQIIRLPLHFDGNDYDIQSTNFWNSLDEKGQWGVDHPVEGFKSLQLISARKSNKPVEQGGYCVIETEWIEPLNKEGKVGTKSLAAMSSLINTSMIDSSAVGFLDKALIATEAAKQGIKNTTDEVVGNINKYLGPISKLSTNIFAIEMAAQRSFNDLYNATVLNAQMLAGQFMQIIQFPLASTNDAKSRLKAYEQFSQSVSAMIAKKDENVIKIEVEDDEYAKNTLLVAELASIATVGAICQIGTTSDIQSPDIGFTIIDTIERVYDDLKESLDYAQVEFEDEQIEKRFVINEDVEAEIMNLITTVKRYIITEIMVRRPVKTIVLSEPTTPYKLVFETYGSDGENQIDRFIEINNLHEEQIILLPAGMEVII